MQKNQTVREAPVSEETRRQAEDETTRSIKEHYEQKGTPLTSRELEKKTKEVFELTDRSRRD